MHILFYKFKMGIQRVAFLLAFVLICSVNLGEGYMVNNNPYRQRVNVDPLGKYVLEWVVNHVERRITFNVTVESTGYIGFGLSSRGKMTGADIVIGGVMPSGKWYFSDRHAVANQMPEEDPSQDWKLHEARESETHTFLCFSRAFDTCDPQDYPITEDKITIIWAYGQKDERQAYHHRNRGVYDAYLLHPDYSPPITKDEVIGHTEIVMEGSQEGENAARTNDKLKVWTINTMMELPARDTFYYCTMHKAPELPGKHHVVGLDVRLDDLASRRHTYHLMLHKCNAPRGRSPRRMFHSFLGNRGQECFMLKSPTGPMPTEYCTEFFQSWAVGGRPMFHPPHVGIPVGNTQDEYYLLQIHFDNPNLLTGVTVNVSLDMFYTSELRPNDGGLLMIRHESPGLTPSLHIPPSSIDHTIYGICGAECTREFLPASGIKLYAMLLHSHNAGKGIRLQQFRGKRELPWVLSDENYSFNYQQWRVLTSEARVLRGDQLVVRCNYDNSGTNGAVVGGFSTRQEACVAFLYYYTKILDHQQCSSEIDSPEGRERFLGVRNVTWSYAHLEDLVSSPQSLAGKRITEVSNDYVEWNYERREALQRFHLTHPHVNRCPGELYAVEADNIEDISNGSRGGRYPTRKLIDRPSDLRGRVASFPHDAKPYKPRLSCSFGILK